MQVLYAFLMFYLIEKPFHFLSLMDVQAGLKIQRQEISPPPFPRKQFFKAILLLIHNNIFSKD